MPEILAPAGGIQALEAAVACGADAVYLGIDVLNARRNAENFTADNLAQTVRKCHIRGVRVYLTLNTVVLEQEIPQLLDAAETACAAGVDGVIVQDFGAAALLRRCAPGLRLSGSTQMAVHNPEGVRMLEDMGFSRVVLARECTRDEIAGIVASTSLEVEVFVHGALCMCVSGQCYLSSVLGQRSGNRGLCAQPCRLPFSTEATGYALSLKDMSLIQRMEELREIGVSSLKIEGRMKRPEYVAAAVTACRMALAGENPDLESLRSVFSRSGFTDGYFSGRRNIEMFGIRQKEDVTAAAGVLGKLANLYNEPRNHIQRVGVEFAFAMKPGQPAFLSVLDSDGNSLCVEGPVPEQARSKPTDPERARAGLSKTGGTPYRVDGVLCSIADGLMLPASAINAMRRDALERLDALRGAPRAIRFNRTQEGRTPDCTHAPSPRMRVRACRAEQVTPWMLEQAELVLLPPDELARSLRENPGQERGKLCAVVPRILFEGQERLRGILEALHEQGVRHAAVGNLGGFKLVSGIGMELHAEPFFNTVNSHAAGTLAGWGVCDIAWSFELSLEAAKRLASPVPCGMWAYGRLPLMAVRNCPVRAAVGCSRCRQGENQLVDRKKEHFTTNCAFGCSEILNSVPLYMGDRMRELRGLDFYLLNFTDETPAECEKICRMYQTGGEFHGKFTRGLFYKTIL